ncbi:hypothetical protein AAHH80_36880, partial [Burkholderia pseudomallei]
QVGYANRFHHPHPTGWARYAGRCIELPRTDRDGAVRGDVTSSGALAEPVRFRAAHRRYWLGRGRDAEAPSGRLRRVKALLQ